MLKNPRFWAGICTTVLVPAISGLGVLLVSMAKESEMDSN